MKTLTPAHLDAYAQSLRDRAHAPATVEKYLRDVRAFALWLAGGPSPASPPP